MKKNNYYVVTVTKAFQEIPTVHLFKNDKDLVQTLAHGEYSKHLSFNLKKEICKMLDLKADYVVKTSFSKDGFEHTLQINSFVDFN